MQSDVDNIEQAAAEYLSFFSEQRKKDLVLCKFDVCDRAVALWERSNFVNRGTAALHMRLQRARKKQPAPAKGSNAEQSFWKPEELARLFKHEAFQALQDEVDGLGQQHSPPQEHSQGICLFL